MALFSIHFFSILASKRYFSVTVAMNIKDRNERLLAGGAAASGTYQQQLAASHQPTAQF